MTARKRSESASTSSWLLDEASAKAKAKRKSTTMTRKPAASEASEWLKVASPGVKGSSGGSKANGSGKSASANTASPRQPGADSDSRSEKERLEGELRRAHETIEEQQGRIAVMEDQIQTLEAEKEAEFQVPPLAKKRSRRSRKRPSRSSGRDSAGTVNLNEATFEQLRTAGLSVTQSARLIAYREARGGYESLDELEGIPGISRHSLSDLRKRLRV